MVAAAAPRLQATAAALAEVDVLAALAELARSRNYVRPTVVAEPVLDIDLAATRCSTSPSRMGRLCRTMCTARARSDGAGCD